MPQYQYTGDVPVPAKVDGEVKVLIMFIQTNGAFDDGLCFAHPD